MKQVFALLACTGFMAIQTQSFATVWRVNNNPGASAAFTNFNTAVASSSVVSGDTLYLESSATAYTPAILNKRLVIIGPGYFLDPANVSNPGNAGLQVSTHSARFTSSFSFDSLATGSKFMGVEFSALWLDPRADNITFERCFISSISWNVAAANANQRAVGLRFNKCFLSGGISINTTFSLEAFELTNCIINTSFSPGADLILSGLIRNNIFTNSVSVRNVYFSNNIITGVGASGFSGINSIVRNNISQFSGVFPVGNGNQVAPGNDITRIIVNTGSADGRFRLSANSIAIGAGETVNGVTPDVGPFGTGDPYRLSGIPAIPTIYALTTPASVPAAATTMNITLSTRSNN